MNRDLLWSFLVVPQRSAEDGSSADTLGRALDLAGVAADAGLAACYFPEHHGRADDYVSAPLVLAAVAAGRRPDLRVATGVSLLPLHNPVTFAEQASVLDVATGGRLHRLGVGLGNVAAEFRALGVPHDEMVGRFEAGLDIVQRLWSGERVSRGYGGALIEDAFLAPAPVQPTAPLAIGAMSMRGVERAGRLGLPWIADPMHPLDALERLADRYRAAAGDRGGIVLMRQAWVTHDEGAVQRDWWPHVRRSIWTFSLAAGRLREEPELASVSTVDDLRFEHFRPRFMVGTPTEVVDRSRAAAERLGAEEIVLRFGFETGPTQAAVRAALAALAGALPLSRSRSGGTPGDPRPALGRHQ